MNPSSGSASAWALASILTMSAAFCLPTTVLAAPDFHATRIEGAVSRTEISESGPLCCHLGLRDWWSSGSECNRASGSPTAASQCHDDRSHYRDSERMCCERNNTDWWSTYSECGKLGGRSTVRRNCSNVWNTPVPTSSP
ncbi:MAG: hypothetical protein ABL973_09815 [Micropepsaceae bacterium]